jgi:hypothetical protein
MRPALPETILSGKGSEAKRIRRSRKTHPQSKYAAHASCSTPDFPEITRDVKKKKINFPEGLGMALRSSFVRHSNY